LFKYITKSLAEFAAKAAKKKQSFSAGACTWQKILIRLQVWNLSLEEGQIMRAADCKNLAEKTEGIFRQAKKPLCKRTAAYVFTGEPV